VFNFDSLCLNVIDRKLWTEKETVCLIVAHSYFGNEWSRIKKEFSNVFSYRCKDALRIRWNLIEKKKNQKKIASIYSLAYKVCLI